MRRGLGTGRRRHVSASCTAPLLAQKWERHTQSEQAESDRRFSPTHQSPRFKGKIIRGRETVSNAAERALEESEIGNSRIGSSRFEISNWTLWAGGGSDRSGDYKAKFFVFRDIRTHFVARKETICDNLLQPRLGFVEFLENNSQFMDEVRATFCSPSLRIVCCSGKTGAHKLLANVAPLFGSRKCLGDSRCACAKLNQALL